LVTLTGPLPQGGDETAACSAPFVFCALPREADDNLPTGDGYGSGHGLPTALGGVPEMVRDGFTGLLVPNISRSLGRRARAGPVDDDSRDR
jgi:hypothetical protein